MTDVNNNGKIKLLYLDDEMNNLVSFKASFRMDYTILTANSAEEAVTNLRKHPDISVIISDQRMPDKTGVEFFEDIRQEFPHPVRILLTGYTDIESVIAAINRGHIFRYITKPWVEADIHSAIDEASKFYITAAMLTAKNEELQKAYTELDKFAYSATHDMRGPILSVLGIIDLAKGTENVGEVKEMLSMIENAMLRLDNYIQNIHDYYNIRRGEVQLTEIDFNDIVKDLKDIYDITSKLSNTSFTVSVAKQENFKSDEVSIKIILNNLLSNAFKYQKKSNSSKFVDLKIEIAKGVASISVSDNGIGIPASSIDHIFNMFYRATNEELGSGFGLYNVKDALGKLNGKIEVNSVEGEGSTFKITIPSK
jgi:two-component system sensor histidine kinase/response regulator